MRWYRSLALFLEQNMLLLRLRSLGYPSLVDTSSCHVRDASNCVLRLGLCCKPLRFGFLVPSCLLVMLYREGSGRGVFNLRLCRQRVNIR